MLIERPVNSDTGHSIAITNACSRCIGADQARELDGADSMTGSEKPRQPNLGIGGATQLAADGRQNSVIADVKFTPYRGFSG
jgi:hypothetical protein